MYFLFVAVFLSLVFSAPFKKEIMSDGDFSTLVGEHRISAPKPGFKTIDLSLNEDMCVSRVTVRGTAGSPVQLFIHRVSGIKTRDPKTMDQYDWLELSSGYTTDFSIPTTIGVLSDEFADCGFLFRITASSDDESLTFEDITFESDSEKVLIFQGGDSRKRQANARTTCYTLNTYLDCSNIGGSALSTDGGLCLSVGSQLLCGCATHQDCYTSIQRPFCLDGVCSKCKVAISPNVFGGAVPSIIPASTPTTSLVESFRFCRARFPTPYLTSTSVPVNISNLPSPDRLNGVQQSGVDFFTQFVGVESVGTHQPPPNSQTQGFYKEVCDTQSTTSDGSCKGCNQAYLASGDLNSRYNGLSFSAANFPGANDRTRARATGGAIGTVFCTETRPDLPICADPDFWALVGATSAYTIGISALRGANLNQPSYINNNWDMAGLYNSVGGEGNDKPQSYYGSCLPCGATINGVFTRLHGLCAAMSPRSPICTGTRCAPCADNADCFQLTGCATMGNCTAFDQVGTATQQNCQLDGSCLACRSNADCGALDGGSQSNQPNCQAGLCTSPVLCSSNAFCIALNPAAPNCNLDGSCISCLNSATSPSQALSNARCGGTDGPPSPVPASDAQFQQVCSLSGSTIGQCVLCSANSVCAGLGANCQFDGTCRNCASAGYPGCPTTDGPPNTPQRQTICNSNTGICVPACTSNTDALDSSSCSNIYGVPSSSAFFLNCQADGTCITCCNSTGACSCSIDGPPPGNTPQTQCNSQGLCIAPFRCGVNNDCTQPGQSGNCQTTGNCVPCAISRAGQSYTSTCELDGGETPGQQNCQLNSRLCVGACGVGNVGCGGTQGANCMTNGVCITCQSDEDCSNSQRGNKWGADISGQSKCRLSSGTCYNPYVCTRSQPGSLTANGVDNTNCRTQGTGNNCMNDGTCITCTKNSDCANDGGSVAYQPVCDIPSGTCVSCNVNNDCKNAGSLGGNNCGISGSCYNCASSSPFTIPPSSTKVTGPTADANCCASSTSCQDGGEIKSQPNCDTATGICVNYCTADYQCAATNGGCTPKCALDRGCCVECNVNADCPVNNPLIQWRNAEASLTQCTNHVCTPPNGVPGVPPTPVGNGCYTDAQCAVPTPACSLTQGRCVPCLFDVHCPNNGVCVTNEQVCAVCLYDTHCGPTQICSTNRRICIANPNYVPPSSAAPFATSVFLLASALLAVFAF